MSQLSYIFGKKFKGGPDFRLESTHHYDLNGIDLEITAPDSNVVFDTSKNESHFPFKIPGWFDSNFRQSSNHRFVPLNAGGTWYYMGPFWKVGNQPFGSLGFSARIKRCLPEKKLHLGDINKLKAAIVLDYKSHFESDTPGKYGEGQNTKTRIEASEKYDKPHLINLPEMQLRKEKFIETYSQEIPNAFETKEFGMTKWLFYSLKREPNYPVNHYCAALDDTFYLDLHFHYALDFRSYFHLWKDHAEAAEQSMIEKVRLTFPNQIENR